MKTLKLLAEASARRPQRSGRTSFNAPSLNKTRHHCSVIAGRGGTLKEKPIELGGQINLLTWQ